MYLNFVSTEHCPSRIKLPHLMIVSQKDAVPSRWTYFTVRPGLPGFKSHGFKPFLKKYIGKEIGYYVGFHEVSRLRNLPYINTRSPNRGISDPTIFQRKKLDYFYIYETLYHCVFKDIKIINFKQVLIFPEMHVFRFQMNKNW